jgi:SAM-dependent methyltransferase
MPEPNYIDQSDRLRSFLETSKPPRRLGALGKIADHAPQNLITPMRVLSTHALTPLSKHKLAKYLEKRPLLLHLGCGYERKERWINVDLVPGNADLFWDLRKGIPFPVNSVDAIFHEHVLEHLSKLEGLRFTEECLRVLKPGAVLRVVVPDAGRAIRGYVQDAERYVGPFPTGLMAVESLFYGNGHISMFDSETLMLVLRAAGFREVQEQGFGKSWLDAEAPDTEARREGSLYVDARKG